MKTITKTESFKLLEQTYDHPQSDARRKKACRNRLMLLLMLDAGLRVGECSKLEISDLVFNNEPVKAIKVCKGNSKNNKERFVPTSRLLQKCTDVCIHILWKDILPTTKLYALFAHNPTTPLSVRQIQRIIGATSKIAIGHSINPHVLRHTFASKMMRITSMRVVQELLGHESVQSTQVYTHPDKDDLQDAINKAQRSPAEP